MLSHSHKALVQFISVDHMMQLVNQIGLEPMLTELVHYLKDDYKRWQIFDKTPHIASHLDASVIELMPISDKILMVSSM